MARPASVDGAAPRVWRGWFCLCLLLFGGVAGADSLDDRFATVWESLWHQRGSPSAVVRWPSDIRVRVRGLNQAFHRERIVKALELVASVAGRKVIDVTDLPDAQTQANLDTEIVAEHAVQDNQACYVRLERVSNNLINKAVLKMRERAVYYCVLHEAMHVMGISGHPTGNTVLSYFYQRVDAITELDRLLLRAWYSPAMVPGMNPFAALVVLTDAVVREDAGGVQDAAGRRLRFLSQTVAAMEDFARGNGEVPVVLKRSGTASTEGVRLGRQVIAYYLGWAYSQGSAVVADDARSLQWFERSARDGLMGGQLVLGHLHERGEGGATRSASDAFFWFSLAAAQGSTVAQASAQRMAALLTEEQRKSVQERIAAFK